MPKLKLMFERTVLREIPLGTDTVTIGRLPHNTVVLDNPAVSGSHAEVRPDGNGYAVQDLDSLNGTFWNEQRVTRHGLRPGDVVLIGKHSLVFVPDSAPTAVPPPAAAAPGSTAANATVFLDTKANRERLARQAEAAEAAGRQAAPAVAPKQAYLEVISGASEPGEHPLEAQTTVIGKAATAQIRLRGWFKPATAAVVTRAGSRYVLSRVRGRVRINGLSIEGERDLKNGDLVQVAGASMQFTLR